MVRWLAIPICIASTIAPPVWAMCSLPELEWIESSRYASCINANLSGYGLGLSGADGKSGTGMVLGDAYGSVFARPWFSLHGQAYVRARYENRSEGLSRKDWSRSTEQFYFQLGHPLAQTFHGAIGLLPLPFGVNQDIFQRVLTSRARRFWDESEPGARVSFRLRDDLRAEGGGSWSRDAQIDTRELESFSFRLTKSTDLLSGTKLVASYQARSDSSLRRFGLAALVYSDNDLSGLEWVRKTHSPDNGQFDQVFRFAYQHNTLPWAWTWVYEDLRRDSYRMSYGTSRLFDSSDVSSIKLAASIHYERLRGQKAKHQAYLLFGVSFGLTLTSLGGPTLDAQ